MDTTNVTEPGTSAGAQQVSPTLPAANDPVCGMQVSDPTAIQVEHNGTSYSFCSANCRDAFTSDPSRYTK